jgi:multisubunit Na+/H+ antiporter MnhB subunit
MRDNQKMLALGMVVIVGALLVYIASSDMPAFGSFPHTENAVGQRILENAANIMRASETTLGQTVVANVVTSVVWGYRGYDTLGEATILFTAVAGVVMIFRAARRHE